MLNDVYNRRILELAANIPRLGRLEHPDGTATAHSKLCGSTVTVDLKMDGDTVVDFAHQVKACALGQASSSIMARNVVGAHAAELRQLRESVRRMLKENATPPATEPSSGGRAIVSEETTLSTANCLPVQIVTSLSGSKPRVTPGRFRRS